VSVGAHDFQVTDLLGREVSDKVETVSVVPGVELSVALPRGFVLKPFAEIGVGKETSGGSGSGSVLIYSAGVKTRREQTISGDYVLSFGGGLDWAGSTTTDGDKIQGFATLEVGLDFRRLLAVTRQGRQLDASVFFVVHRFLSDVEFERFQARPVRIEKQFEVGLTFGVEPRFKLWRLKAPRIGVSYRFGDGLEAYRINFGFPF
jgi:hypothetical protein